MSFSTEFGPCEERLVDDPPLVLGLLEVGVGEEEEHLLELSLPEEVGEVLHGVGPQAGDVAVSAGRRVLLAQSGDSERVYQNTLNIRYTGIH